MFFGTEIVGTVTVFLFSGIVTAPQAHAYAVDPSAGTDITTGVNNTNYDVGGSLQNLVSPFSAFINQLKWSDTTGNANGTNFTLPTVNLTPVLQSTFENALSQWLNEFDTWFFSVTGVQLSGIVIALLSLFAWALGLAQQVVSWLLGLFH